MTPRFLFGQNQLALTGCAQSIQLAMMFNLDVFFPAQQGLAV